MNHTCHALDCKNECPPRWLMCRACWKLVPYEYQREVYRTYEARGPDIDASWAEWWRASALAIAAVHKKKNPSWDSTLYINKEFRHADQLEKRGAKSNEI